MVKKPVKTKKKTKTIENRHKFLQDRFIRNFIKHPFKIRAARATAVSRQTVDNWLKDDEKFALAFNEAKEEALENVEQEIHRRAIEGIDHPVIFQGEITDTYKEYSDALLMFYAKALAPEKYKDNTEVSHKGEVTLKVIYDNPPAGYTNSKT
jgi:hypothetical protein